MAAFGDSAGENASGGPAPFVVRYARKALVVLLVFGGAIVASGHYFLTADGFGLSYRLAGVMMVPGGIIVMVHALRYLVSARLVTILPSGLVYHGVVKNFEARWSEITKLGAGQGDEASDSITFHATGPFGIFGKFAINEMLIGGPDGDLATIANALDRARQGAPLGPQPGRRRQPLR